MMFCDTFIRAHSCPLFSSTWVGEGHETVYGTELLGSAACFTVRTVT
jgi:hypothetical protein